MPLKMEPLINAIDRQKNRGKCDLHTAQVINALTDFFLPFLPLKSDFPSFQSEGERVQANVDRWWPLKDKNTKHFISE